MMDLTLEQTLLGASEGQIESLGHESERTVRDGRELRAIVFLLRATVTK